MWPFRRKPGQQSGRNVSQTVQGAGSRQPLAVGSQNRTKMPAFLTERPRGTFFPGFLRVFTSVIAAMVFRGGRMQRPTKSSEAPQYRETNNHEIAMHLSRFIQSVRGAASGPTGYPSDQLLQILTLFEAAAPNSPTHEVSYSLNEVQSQEILEFIQGELSDHTSPVLACVQPNGLRRSFLEVLLWVSSKTDQYPSSLTITERVQPTDRTDYGNGGMNDIFQAKFIGKVVAAKHPRIIAMTPPSRRSELQNVFCRHCLRALNMQNEHILPVFGIVESTAFGGFCMIIPWMGKGNLRHYLDVLIHEHGLSGNALVVKVNGWLRDICKGLSYLHDMGMAHGDVRGENVLVGEGEKIRLTPFGSVATITADGFSSTTQGDGTSWVAPELIDPSSYGLSVPAPTPAGDVYAFACTCVELYTCQSPFSDLRDSQIIERVLKGGRPLRPSKPGEEMSGELWDVLTNCWQQQPAERPPISQLVEVFLGNGV